MDRSEGKAFQEREEQKQSAMMLYSYPAPFSAILIICSFRDLMRLSLSYGMFLLFFYNFEDAPF